MSYRDVFVKYNEKLVETLPMDDQMFIERLFSDGLLPGNLKQQVQSQTTSVRNNVIINVYIIYQIWSIKPLALAISEYFYCSIYNRFPIIVFTMNKILTCKVKVAMYAYKMAQKSKLKINLSITQQQK